MEEQQGMFKRLFALADEVDEKRAVHSAAVSREATSEELKKTWAEYLQALSEYQEHEQLVNGRPE